MPSSYTDYKALQGSNKLKLQILNGMEADPKMLKILIKENTSNPDISETFVLTVAHLLNNRVIIYIAAHYLDYLLCKTLAITLPLHTQAHDIFSYIHYPFQTLGHRFKEISSKQTFGS